MVKFIIGANSTVKSYYLANCKELIDFRKLDIYNYQQQLENENGCIRSDQETYEIPSVKEGFSATFLLKMV